MAEQVEWVRSFIVPTPKYRDDKYMPRIHHVVMMYLHQVSEEMGLPLVYESSPESPYKFTVRAEWYRPFTPEMVLFLSRVQQDIDMLLANVIVKAKKSCWAWLRENHYE